MRFKLFIPALCVFLHSVKAQNFQFINPALSLVNTNPSFAGSNGLIRAQSVYNMNPNWSDFRRYYDYGTTHAVDAFVKPLNAGMALSVSGDGYAGLYKYNRAAFTYAQYFSFRDKQLKIIPSLQLSYSEKSLNHSWFDVYPHRAAALDAGLMVNYKKLYVGLKLANIIRSDKKYDTPYRTLTMIDLNASYNFMFSEKHLLNVYLKTNSQTSGSDLLLGATAVFSKHVIAGLGTCVYDWGYNLNSSLGYRHDLFSVVFSYSRYLTYGTNAGFQLAASFNLRNKEQRHQLTNMESW
jgi:type IX secretion system membrane protein PorP/SprF